jgi:hypothetical protein
MVDLVVHDMAGGWITRVGLVLEPAKLPFETFRLRQAARVGIARASRAAIGAGRRLRAIIRR